MVGLPGSSELSVSNTLRSLVTGHSARNCQYTVPFSASYAVTMRPSFHGGAALSLAMPVAAITSHLSTPPIRTRATAGLTVACPASELPGTALHRGVGPDTAPLLGFTVDVTSRTVMLLPP